MTAIIFTITTLTRFLTTMKSLPSPTYNLTSLQTPITEAYLVKMKPGDEVERGPLFEEEALPPAGILIKPPLISDTTVVLDENRTFMSSLTPIVTAINGESQAVAMENSKHPPGQNKSFHFMQNPKIKLARRVSIIAYSILFVLGATANLTVLYSLTMAKKSYKRVLFNFFQNSWPNKFWALCCHAHKSYNKSSSLQAQNPSVIYEGGGNHGLTRYRGKGSLHSQGSKLCQTGRSFNSHSSMNQQYSSINSRIRLLILHLCIADLLVVFLMVPLEIAWSATVSWKAGDTACRILSYCRIFGIYLSSMVLVVISIDRCYTIYYPLKLYQQNRFVKILLTTAWTISILASLPQYFIFHLETHPEHTWFKQCVTFHSFPSPAHELAYNLFTAIMLYVIPLIVVVTCYSLILIKVRKNSYMLATKTPKPSFKASFKRELSNISFMKGLKASFRTNMPKPMLYSDRPLNGCNGLAENQRSFNKHSLPNFYTIKTPSIKCQLKNSGRATSFNLATKFSLDMSNTLVPPNLIIQNYQRTLASSRQTRSKLKSSLKFKETIKSEEVSSDIYPLNDMSISFNRITEDIISEIDPNKNGVIDQILKGSIPIKLTLEDVNALKESTLVSSVDELSSNPESGKVSTKSEDMIMAEKADLIKSPTAMAPEQCNYLKVDGLLTPNSYWFRPHSSNQSLSSCSHSASCDNERKMANLSRIEEFKNESSIRLKNGLNRDSSVHFKSQSRSRNSQSSTTTTTIDQNYRNRRSFLSIYSPVGGKNSVSNLLRRTQTKRLEGARSKTLKMTTIIIAAFLFCWTPYFVMSFWYYFSKETATKVDPIIQKILFIFAVFNSCFNPLVYGIFNAPTSSSLFKTVLKK